VIRKAIATLQQQSNSHESALDTLKAARRALVEEFEAMKVRYPREITKLEDKIAIFERELIESKAAVLQLQRLATERFTG
jgi:hypothetical protein